jgi:predicted DNA-binding antitoxin AbrB/MazE fold protein
MTKTFAAIYERGVFRLMQPMEIPEGTRVEIIIIPKPDYLQQKTPKELPSEQPLEMSTSNNDLSRWEFMQLPLAERRTILAKQAEQMLPYYQEDKEWQELETGDLIDY